MTKHERQDDLDDLVKSIEDLEETLKKIEVRNKEQEIVLKTQDYKRKNFDSIINAYIKLLLVFIPMLAVVFSIVKEQIPLSNLISKNDSNEVQILNNKINDFDQRYSAVQ